MRISLEEAILRLTHDQIVAVPTETVYGMAAALAFPNAIDNIFVIKGRPSNNPLIIHASTKVQILPFIKTIPTGFDMLANTFWPGPMTLVLSINEDKIPYAVRAGLPTAAFRIPYHPLTRQLLEKTGPLVMPSANVSGRPSATSPEHVENDFGSEFPVLDGGKCQRGVESTILIFVEESWKIIRLGALPPESFESALGYIPIVEGENPKEAPLCPGQMYKHYAPKAKLILTKQFTGDMPVILGFKDRIYPRSSRVISLGSSDNPNEVAENLYSILRQLDDENIPCAWMDMDMPSNGLWNTIQERIRKASGECL